MEDMELQEGVAGAEDVVAEDTEQPRREAGHTDRVDPVQRMVLPHHRQHLLDGGLSNETIAAAGIYSVTDEREAQELLSFADGFSARLCPAIAFPYPGCEDFVRLRPDEPVTFDEGSRKEVHNHARELSEAIEPSLACHESAPTGAKYLSPSGFPTRLYVPVNLHPGILDVSMPLYVTEGEKKALAGCQAGIATIAAPGVTCFRDSEARRVSRAFGDDRIELHPDILRLPHKGRLVVILFDSDIDTNDAVNAEAAVLGKLLDAGGADARISYLPSGGQGKLGLDDFLAEATRAGRLTEAIADIEAATRPLNPHRCLDWLRDQWGEWSSRQQEQELRRVARLAAVLIRDRASLQQWVATASKKLKVLQRDILPLFPKVAGGAVKDARVWLAEWFEHRNVTFDPKTELFYFGGNSRTAEEVFREAALDSRASKVPRQSLEDAFFLYRAKQRHQLREQVVERLAHVATDDSELLRFVRAMTGRTDPVDVAVIKQFIWQVKRKLHDLPVDHHLMPVLKGRTGGGKTRAILRLLEPVAEVTDTPGDISWVADERQSARLAGHYVIFIDEMARAQRTDVDCLKNKLTSSTVSWRVLGTNRTVTLPNRATFIGASNNSLTQIIWDPTGLRRFYQIDCLDRLDWDTINALDMKAVWGCVGANDPCPLVPVLDEVKERQEALRPKDSVEEFIVECCEVGGETWTSAREVFAAYTSFAKERNVRGEFSSIRFGARLKELVEHKQSNGIKYRVKLHDQTAASGTRHSVEQFLEGLEGVEEK